MRPKTRGLLGGDIDIKSGKVLGHTVPNLGDRGAFRIVECRGVTVEVERLGIQWVIRIIPSRTANHVPIEVKIQDVRCARTTVQQEGIVGQGSQ